MFCDRLRGQFDRKDEREVRGDPRSLGIMAPSDGFDPLAVRFLKQRKRNEGQLRHLTSPATLATSAQHRG